MSLLQQIIDGSLVSRERLMQAREFYSPSERKGPARVALARWTTRVSEQPALGLARELAGLSGPELDELETELRIHLPKEIKRALEFGDLRENSEYQTALQRQTMVKARIRELRQRMSEISSIDLSKLPPIDSITAATDTVA